MRRKFGLSITLGATLGLVPSTAFGQRNDHSQRSIFGRFELGYGELTNYNRYQSVFENDDRTVWLYAYPRTTAPAWSGRLTLGAALTAGSMILFPHVFVTYAKTGQFWRNFSSEPFDIPLHLSSHHWALGVGGELQLFRRVLLLDGGVGFSEGYSYYSMPTVEPGRRDTPKLWGVLLHAAVGVRLPLKPATVGFRALAETSVRIIGGPVWPLSIPVVYVAFAGFVEYDVTDLLPEL